MNDEFSDSDAENEQFSILAASRSSTIAPPRKKRRLNNNKSQHSNPSSDESKSESLTDSDKENNNNKNNRKRRHPSQQQSQSQSHAVYKFGKQIYSVPLNVSPGALIRIKLENFLCHDNFEIAFHPNVNIVHGQNGAGKSAIEAGISMALGQNSKKTGRGNSILDVIKDGEEWSKITLYLYNEGPERLPDYGSEIKIERRLSKTGKNGASYFKVFDGDTLKCKGRGLKAVKIITDKFNLNVNNPCVVLKQSTAKQFLNSTKAKDKFKFFMNASKLGNYVVVLDDARENVRQAQEMQKNTKGSFVAIKNQYFEAKEKLTIMEEMEGSKEKVTNWKRAEKYMIYHKEKEQITQYSEMISQLETKITKSKKQLENVEEERKLNISKCKSVKEEINLKLAESDQYIKPLNELKQKLSALGKERKDINKKVNAIQQYIDKSNRKIKDFKRQHQQHLSSLQNNEKTKKLSEITSKLALYSSKLSENRSQRELLKTKCEPTIEMKDNQRQFNQKRNILSNIEQDIKKFENALKQLDKQNHSELFLDPQLKRINNYNNNNRSRNQISIAAIRKTIHKYKRQFHRMPIGPLGEYIQMRDFKNEEQNQRNIHIVQSVLKSSLYVFLVADPKDLNTFGRIMKQTFGKTIVVPCIQYKYSDKMEIINNNPWHNRINGDNIIRVSDMFTIKDNNAWIYNAILCNSNPERVYAYGDLPKASRFLNSLDENKELRIVNRIMTYKEKGLYKVTRRNNTISGTPEQEMTPILQSDKSMRKKWYQQELNKKLREENNLIIEINELQIFVSENNTNLRENKQNFMKINRQIKMNENQIEKLQRQQTDLNEEENDNEEIHSILEELQNSIEDETSNIEQYNGDIEPYKTEEKSILFEQAKYKRQMLDLENKIKTEKHKIDSQKLQFDALMCKIKKQSVATKKVPIKIKQFAKELNDCRLEFAQEKERILNLLSDAKAMGGDEITAEMYPRNERNRNRIFTLPQLKRAREILEGQIEALMDELGDNFDADDVRMRFENIRPKYESHQQRVDNCNNNCDEMYKQLINRRKQFQLMKESVRQRLSMEFKYIMRQQNHDGRLVIDYENGTLDMECTMSSHDGQSQVRNTKTLSGGERSYAQVALIMALQKFSGSPMCIYDEFDVFMDSVNRGNSIKILLNAALGNKNSNQNNNNNNDNDDECVGVGARQYIFITPNDVSPIIAEGHKNEVRIHQLKAPRRH